MRKQREFHAATLFPRLSSKGIKLVAPAATSDSRKVGHAIRRLLAADRAADRTRAVCRERLLMAGNQVGMSPIIAEIRASGATSLGRIAKALNERGICTPRGAEWQSVQVKRVLERMATEVKA